MTLGTSARATTANPPVPRSTTERVRKTRLIERYGDRVAAAGLRVGYADDNGPRALVPARLRDMREPLSKAGCALFPARVATGTDGPVVPPAGRPPGIGSVNGLSSAMGGGRGEGPGPGTIDADYRLAVERAVGRVHRDLEPITKLVSAGTRPPAVERVVRGSGELDAEQADLLRSLYLELVDEVGAQRSKILTRLNRLIEDAEDDQ